jgi:hypothetical protein
MNRTWLLQPKEDNKPMRLKIKKKKLVAFIWIAIVVIASLSLVATSILPIFFTY